MRGEPTKRNWYLLEFAELFRTRHIDAVEFIVNFFRLAVKDDSAPKSNFFAVLRQIKTLGGATDTRR